MADHDLHPPANGTDDGTDDIVDGPLLELHDQLVAAIRRQQGQTDSETDSEVSEPGAEVVPLAARRHRATRMVAAAAGVVLIAATSVTFVLAGDQQEVAADVTVQRDGNRVTVSLEDSVTVSEIADEMRKAGVEVDVVGVPTGPSRVNRFVGIIGPPSSELVGGDGEISNSATFVAGSQVVLQLGVLGDGAYDSATDAFARGEGLEGPSLAGETVAAAQDELTARAATTGVTISYLVLETGARSPDAPPDAVIQGAAGVSRTEVMVAVMAAPTK